ncbi:MAG: hypothetical protein AAF483_15665 [Planctomycetota bacterium]
MGKHIFSCLTILSLCAFAGCGGPTLPTIDVTGSVTVDGQPMEGVSVIFSPAASSSGRAATGQTDAQGNFKLTTETPGDGALAGDYKVAITKAQTADDNLPKEVDPDDPDSMDSIYGSLDTQKQEKSTNLIGKKWTSAATSGLTATVAEGGDNTFNFEVTSK